MRRLSISDKGMFIPEEGEIFFAEVPYNCIDRRLKTLVSKDDDPCARCVDMATGKCQTYKQVKL